MYTGRLRGTALVYLLQGLAIGAAAASCNILHDTADTEHDHISDMSLLQQNSSVEIRHYIRELNFKCPVAILSLQHARCRIVVTQIPVGPLAVLVYDVGPERPREAGRG